MLLIILAGYGVAREASVISSALRSGIMAKGILLILFFFSIASWAIMVGKFLHFRSAKAESLVFLKRIRAEKDPANIERICIRHRSSHLARILKQGLLEGENPVRSWRRLKAPQMIEKLDTAISNEVVRFEEMLVFLAIGGSVCPLLGLLGTVWGVMDAFLGMETYHSASISAVAPGISDALITTIAGLAAAIPAVVGYNYFINRVRVLTVEMENFAREFAGKFTVGS